LGQKIHPVGFRVGVIRGFDSHWFYTKKGYGAALLSDHNIRAFIKNRVGLGNVSRVEIERPGLAPSSARADGALTTLRIGSTARSARLTQPVPFR